MCRLFAFGLLEAPDSLEAQIRREPDGYGIGKDGAPPAR